MNIQPYVQSTWQKPTETVGAMTFYVDPAGSDSNPGTLASPFLTIQKALNSVPLYIKHAVTINIAAGTYSENIVENHIVTESGSMTVQGTSFLAVTPATGPGTGTFTSNAGRLLTLAAAGWTINDLAGKWLKITSGTYSGSYFPIVSNTATDIELSQEVSTIGNASFEMYTFGATISQPAGGDTNIAAVFMIDGGRQIFNSGSLSNQAIWQYLNITNADTNKRYLVKTNRYGIDFISCNFSTNGTNVFYANEGRFDGTRLTNCRLYNSKATTNSSYGATVQYGYLTLNRCHLKGPGGANGYYGLYISSGTATLSSSLIEDWDGTSAIYVYGSAPRLTMSSSMIRNGDYGIVLECQNGLVTYSSTNYIIDQDRDGIVFQGCTNVSVVPAFVTLSNAILIMTGNRSSFQFYEGIMNVVRLNGASDISSNDTWAFWFTAGTSNRNNSVHISSTTTMAGNGSGDFALDGSTNTALATLRADPDKIIVDLTRLNVISTD